MTTWLWKCAATLAVLVLILVVASLVWLVVVPQAGEPQSDAGGSLLERAELIEVEPPAYPWPPERPSSTLPLTRAFSDLRGRALGEVADRLGAALTASGFDERSFYTAPGGFVVASRIEKIAADGARLPDTERYLLPRDLADTGLIAALAGLFYDADPGFWRYVAFVVTDRAYVAAPGTLAGAAAEERVAAGARRLDTELAREPFTNAHVVDALIYEFQLDAEAAEPAPLRPGRLPPTAHLEKAGLLAALEAYP